MRYGAGLGLFDARSLPCSPTEETRQREIDDAWDELVLSADERDQVLAVLRLKRYVRESKTGSLLHDPEVIRGLSGLPGPRMDAPAVTHRVCRI